MSGRPPRPRQDRFEAMTSSIMERIAFRSGREGKTPKVSPSSKVYISAISTRFDTVNRSQRSTKSHRSSWTGGRQHDYELDDSSDLAHAFDNDNKTGSKPAQISLSQSKLPVRRVSTRRLRFMSNDQMKKVSATAVDAAAKPGTEDILSGFVYTNPEDGRHESDGGGSESEHDEEDPDSQTFMRQAISDAEDEMAYFANRPGLSDFKARRRYTLHPHGRFRACWDIFQILLMTCETSLHVGCVDRSRANS